MINNFKDTQVRDSGLIYNGTFSQIKKLYEKDPVMAGELAISAIELVLTGEISSDDFMIEMLLENVKVVNEKNKEKYNKRVESQQQKRIEELKLAEIAELHKQGLKQVQIAERLGIKQQLVSYRLGIIRTEFPHLLEDFTKNTKNTKNTTYDTDTDTDTDIKQNGATHHPTGADAQQKTFKF